MFDWFWKWLGYHVCEEFTQWQTVVYSYSRLPYSMTEKVVSGWQDRINYTEKVQERRCTICGTLQQRKLKH